MTLVHGLCTVFYALNITGISSLPSASLCYSLVNDLVASALWFGTLLTHTLRCFCGFPSLTRLIIHLSDNIVNSNMSSHNTNHLRITKNPDFVRVLSISSGGTDYNFILRIRAATPSTIPLAAILTAIFFRPSSLHRLHRTSPDVSTMTPLITCEQVMHLAATVLPSGDIAVVNGTS